MTTKLPTIEEANAHLLKQKNAEMEIIRISILMQFNKAINEKKEEIKMFIDDGPYAEEIAQEMRRSGWVAIRYHDPEFSGTDGYVFRTPSLEPTRVTIHHE